MGALLFLANNLLTEDICILVLRGNRSAGLNPARGGLPRGSYLAKYAIRHYGLWLCR